MDEQAIADRRRLRRKLTFWRCAAFVIVAAVLGAYAYAHASRDPRAAAHIAQIAVHGLITDDDELVARLDAVAARPSAKALILSINSPGGTTYGGERVYEAVRRVAAKKPVVADIRTLGASAAYMVALGGDRIVAEDTSIVGSIGVIFQYPQLARLMDKIGISVDEIKSAPLKGEPSPFHPPSPAASAMIQSMIKDSYGWFVDLVAERRHLAEDRARALADGSVFTGRQALANGLVDALGGERAARDWLAHKGVGRNLPLVDWKSKEGGGLPFLSQASALIFQLVGEGRSAATGVLSGITDSKLFLDGLISVWQVGPDPSKME